MKTCRLGITALSLASRVLMSGCQTPEDSQSVVDVDALSTESLQLTTCSIERLVTKDRGDVSSQVKHDWHIDAPEDAIYGFEAEGAQASFVARTPGAYRIALTRCSLTGSAGCSELQIPVVVTPSDCNRSDSDDDAVAGNAPDSDDLADGTPVDCTPDCSGRECGADSNCGQSCGTCAGDLECNSQGQCEAACVPVCTGLECGPDSRCGKSCGTCAAGQACNPSGQCTACVPNCTGLECGRDPVCGQSCGECSGGSTCSADGKCVAPTAGGRVVTIVMGLTNRELVASDPRRAVRARLVEQSVRWVSPVAAPKVLVVLDDNCRGECGDAELVVDILKGKRFSVVSQREPRGGLRTLQGFDVVWFTNPNRAVDDDKTAETLLAFVRNGGGLVLSGDDITHNPLLDPLTRLHYVADGTRYCGRTMDGGAFGSYEVSFASTAHPVSQGLTGASVYYGADIDSSNLIPGGKVTVLAWAQLPRNHVFHCSSGKCERQPAIVAYDTGTP